MKIYITAPFTWGDNKVDIDNLCAAVKRAWFDDYCFVRDEEVFDDFHEMMEKAKTAIQECDALLLEYDWPSHGRMIELGIAYAMNKKIIIIAKNGITIKNTVKWVATSIIPYDSLEDIIQPMAELLGQMESL